MFNIGIVGSDNTHAGSFANLVNFPDPKTGEYLFPDFKITGIFGLDRKRTEEVAENGKIEYIADRPEDFIGKVDAVMVVFRHGDLHLPYALPFIEAGIPTWVDKPFTIKNEDARRLIEAAKTHNTLLAGGSNVKFAYDLQIIRNASENGSRIGRLETAVINFPASIESQYGGIYFYGSHLAEMTLKAFGYNARSVIASENNGCVAAILQYDAFQVTMNFIPGSKEYFAVLYGENGTMIREIDLTGSMQYQFGDFAEMLRTGKVREPFENLFASVELMNGVKESYSTGKEVKLYGL